MLGTRGSTAAQMRGLHVSKRCWTAISRMGVLLPLDVDMNRFRPAGVADQVAELSSGSGQEAVPLGLDLAIPLVLDLDGTLFATDTLHESLILFLRKHPSDAWRVPGWVLSGRAVAKERLAVAVAKENLAHFPANVDLVSFAEREAARGRRVVLATAADRAIAEKAAARFPFITEIIASDGQENLKGQVKARELMSRFPDGFVYAGDFQADLHIWRQASGAIVVGGGSALERKVGLSTPILATFPGARPKLRRFGEVCGFINGRRTRWSSSRWSSAARSSTRRLGCMLRLPLSPWASWRPLPTS